jgi:hypothetical protein
LNLNQNTLLLWLAAARGGLGGSNANGGDPTHWRASLGSLPIAISCGAFCSASLSALSYWCGSAGCQRWHLDAQLAMNVLRQDQEDDEFVEAD